MQIVPVSRIDDNVSFRGICGLCRAGATEKRTAAI